MTQESYRHPITPPPELVQQWDREYREQEKVGCIGFASSLIGYIAARAAQWGADQELEECCEEMKSLPSPLGIPFGEMASNALRSARRPEPPSLKEQALEALAHILNNSSTQLGADTIRRALEQLDD